MAVHRHAAVRAAYRERARVLPGAPAKVSVKLATLTIAISAFLDGVLRRDAEQAGARFVVKPPNVAAISALLGPPSASEPSLTRT